MLKECGLENADGKLRVENCREVPEKRHWDWGL